MPYVDYRLVVMMAFIVVVVSNAAALIFVVMAVNCDASSIAPANPGADACGVTA